MDMDMDFVCSPFTSRAATPFDNSLKHMDLQPFDLYPPLDPPSREDWERFKTTILEQYIGPSNMTVKDLVQHMEMWYTFRAT